MMASTYSLIPGNAHMEAIRIRTTVEEGGRISLADLPLKQGQQVEVILLVGADDQVLTARQLAESEVVGLWADREDIQDSAAYARELRSRRDASSRRRNPTR
jgi:endonuclease YncB( thermonuclease family)